MQSNTYEWYDFKKYTVSIFWQFKMYKGFTFYKEIKRNIAGEQELR